MDTVYLLQIPLGFLLGRWRQTKKSIHLVQIQCYRCVCAQFQFPKCVKKNDPLSANLAIHSTLNSIVAFLPASYLGRKIRFPRNVTIFSRVIIASFPDFVFFRPSSTLRQNDVIAGVERIGGKGEIWILMPFILRLDSNEATRCGNAEKLQGGEEGRGGEILPFPLNRARKIVVGRGENMSNFPPIWKNMFWELNNRWKFAQ